jgi:hypothetical protein
MRNPIIAVSMVLAAAHVAASVRPPLQRMSPALNVLRGVPLAERPVDLELTRSPVFARAARIEVVGPRGRTRALPVPREKIFVGRTATDPESRATVIIGRSMLRGTVTTRGHTYRLTSGAGGLHAEEMPADADTTLGCAADDGLVALPDRAEQRTSALPAGTQLEVDLAVDTDHELWALFGRDVRAVNLVVDLVSAANAVYERETGIHFRIGYLRLWRTPDDPWTALAIRDQLFELEDEWLRPGNGLEPVLADADTVHMVSGRHISGSSDSFLGVAFLGAACSTNRFGLTRVAPRTTVSESGAMLTFAHELGHTLGSKHTHCYDPPIDHCWAREPGCYAGPEQQVDGTIMSYCATREMTFHERTRDVIRGFAEDATCLAPLCADGSNTACDDTDPCTEDACTAEGACAHTPIPGCCRDPLCDDDDACTIDRCDATQGCIHEAIAGCCLSDGQCDDGDVCTRDTCNANRCEHPLWDIVRTTCDDGNACTRDCTTAGPNLFTCIREALPGCCIDDSGCDDGNACTVDECDATSHCTHAPALQQPGCCRSDEGCDDADPCTVGRCDGQFRCAFEPAPDGTSCRDAACANGEEACGGGTCRTASPPPAGVAGLRCGLADVDAATSGALSPRIRGKLEPLRQRVRSQEAAFERIAARGGARRVAKARRRLERALRRIRGAVDAAATRGGLSGDARDAVRGGVQLCLDRLTALGTPSGR